MTSENIITFRGRTKAIEPIQNPKKMVKAAVSLSGKSAEWGRISKIHSQTESVTTNLARYLTLTVQDIDGATPLLASCIATAATACQRAHQDGEDMKASFVKYLRGLLYRLPEALECKVGMDSQNERLWLPLEETVIEWHKSTRGTLVSTPRKRNEDVSYVGMNPADYRFIVLIRFIAPKTLSMSYLSSHLDEIVMRYG